MEDEITELRGFDFEWVMCLDVEVTQNDGSN